MNEDYGDYGQLIATICAAGLVRYGREFRDVVLSAVESDPDGSPERTEFMRKIFQAIKEAIGEG